MEAMIQQLNMSDRIGQVFERQIPGGITEIIEIVGVEKAGYEVDDDSYKGIRESIFMDGSRVSGSKCYCDIDEFEYKLRKGVYKQLK